MDQIKCASLSHTHYWYEVGMLKVHDKLMLKSNPWSQGRKTSSERKAYNVLYIQEENVVQQGGDVTNLSPFWEGMRENCPSRGHI